MKPWMLILIGLAWLAVIVGFIVFVSGDFMVAGVHLRSGLLAYIEMVFVLILAAIVLFGWLVPLSVGVQRLVRQSRRAP
jgi:hypothetical protein